MQSPLSFSFDTGGVSGPRAGRITTPHGVFETPAFSPVGTKATVKAVLPEDMKERVGAQVLLANTYHLYLQPGEEVVAEAGGLHRFMGWDRPLITDSGGFQVFSLGVAFGKRLGKFTLKETSKEEGVALYDADVASQHGQLAIVDEEGVTFTSHLDGSLHRFTPERSVEIQHKLGADIFFAFDDFVAPTAKREAQIESMRRTHAWAERCIKAHRFNLHASHSQALFGIVQGGRHEDLRAESAKAIAALDFDGYGIGGTFSKDDLGTAIRAAITELDPTKPRHLLGIGEPEDIFLAVEQGIDMFDCVLPTRMGRTGMLYTARGKINILNEKYIRDFSPLCEATGGYASAHFTKAYLAHLFRAKEMLAATIASMHNLFFIQKLMGDIRASVQEGNLADFRESFFSRYHSGG
jgi:queuine tRNA-ribosyltransferase